MLGDCYRRDHVDAKPLNGQTFVNASKSPAADLASFILSDLGASVREAPSNGAADIVDLAETTRGPGVNLSPYGRNGRFAAAPAHDSAVDAIGGALMAQYTYEPGPAYLVTPYATVGQALLTTAAVLAQRLCRTSPPPPAISALQGLFAVQTGAYAYGPTPDTARWKSSPRGQMATYSTYRAADDWIFIGASTHVFMLKVIQTLGLDDILADPRTHEDPRAFKGTPLEQELWDQIGETIAGHPRDHWLRIFEQAGIPAGPILSMEEALAHPQIAAAQLVEPGEPIGRLANLIRVTRRGFAQPRAIYHDGPLPLSGVRVVELAGYIAGSYAGRLLSDLGANVVKVEPPGGDPFRVLGYGFVAWNYGKRGLALDLRSDTDRTRLLQLVSDADILLTNYRPEALARMGVGRETLFEVNPALVHCTISAFGESGPIAHLPGFDPVVQGFAGIMRRQGGEDEPVKPQIAATDYLSAMLSVIGMLSARLAQVERGGGYVVQTSLLSAALLLNEPAYSDVRAGRPYLTGGRDFKGPHPLNGLHPVADGWILTAAPDIGEDRNLAGVLAFLDGGVRSAITDDALRRLASIGVPAVPVLDPSLLTDESHFAANNLWLTVDQPEQGALTFPAPVLGPAVSAPAPAVGQDNTVDIIWSDA
jgi:crotonobetainyl-CoA:carnitine CoA-transferase CaiB-like acyl-CoA transferase